MILMAPKLEAFLYEIFGPKSSSGGDGALGALLLKGLSSEAAGAFPLVCLG